MVLSTMSSFLKDMATKYNIAVCSYTQVNANAYNQEELGSNAIAGSRAVVNCGFWRTSGRLGGLLGWIYGFWGFLSFLGLILFLFVVFLMCFGVSIGFR